MEIENILLKIFPKGLANILIDYKDQLEFADKKQILLDELISFVPNKRNYIQYEYISNDDYGLRLIVKNVIRPCMIFPYERKRYIRDKRFEKSNHGHFQLVEWYGKIIIEPY